MPNTPTHTRNTAPHSFPTAPQVDPSGRQFCLVCAALFSSLGFGDVRIVDGPGDGGVDIMMTDRAERTSLVQVC